jgi:hypothetical protein
LQVCREAAAQYPAGETFTGTQGSLLFALVDIGLSGIEGTLRLRERYLARLVMILMLHGDDGRISKPRVPAQEDAAGAAAGSVREV